MGGAAAIFKPIYSLIFTPLPFPQADRLVRIGGNIPLFNLETCNFEQREFLGRIFSNLTAYSAQLYSANRVKVEGAEEYIDMNPTVVTEEFFETLGVQPIIGNGFRHIENVSGVIVSHRFWQKKLMGVDAVIGKSLFIGEKHVFTIAGVMPETFDFPIGTDVWIRRNERRWNDRWPPDPTQFIGRLRPGISREQAARDLRAIDFKIPPGSPRRWFSKGPVLQSLQAVFYGDQLSLLLMIGAAAFLFLLLVCTGAANYLITYGISRKSEMAIRLVHGATRWKLVCQLLRETLPLVLIGGLAGLGVAKITDIWLTKQFPTLMGGEIATHARMLFFTALVAAVTIVSGLFPALKTSGVDINAQLKSASGSDGSGRRIFSTREILVGVQLSLTLTLLIGGGVLLRSVVFNINIPTGWSSEEIIVVDAMFSYASITSETERIRWDRFYQEAQQQLETMPEVISVGHLRPVPFSTDAARSVQTENYTEIYKDTPAQDYRERQKQLSISCIQGTVSPKGFDVLSVPLIAGRLFSEADITRARVRMATFEKEKDMSLLNGEIVINRTVAQHFWPGENAVGKTVYYTPSISFEIVGVISDFYLIGNTNTVTPAIYRPAVRGTENPQFLVKLRSNKLLASFQTNARRRLLDLDEGLMWVEVRRLQEMVSDSKKDQRLALQLIACFTGLGIAVSGLGVFSTTALMAAARSKEIGIRIAMGAQFSDILRLILLRSARVLIIGLPCGLFLGWALTHGLSSTLYQVHYNDPAVWIYSCFIILFITIIAALIPALKAALINPLEAIRNE